MITGLVQPISLSQSQRLTPRSSPRHLVEPAWPPYRAEAMVSPLLVALCSDYGGTCWATCKPALKGAARSQTPQFQLQFAIRSIFPCNRSPAYKPRGDWATSEGGAFASAGRPSDWLPPLAECRPPALVAAGLRRELCANGTSNGDAPPQHDRQTTQGSAELNEGRLRACQRVQSRPCSSKKVTHWRPRDYNRCHCWHVGTLFPAALAKKRAYHLAINNSTRVVSPCLKASRVSPFTPLCPSVHRQPSAEQSREDGRTTVAWNPSWPLRSRRYLTMWLHVEE